MSGLRRIAVCCLLAILASAAFADPPKTDLETIFPSSRGRITQEAYDGLKAGRPQTAMISFYAGRVDADADAERRARHLTRADGSIIEMRLQGYKALKARFLADYAPGDIQVVQDHPTLPELTISIHSLRVLQQLLADTRVHGIFVGSVRIYPAVIH
ncbi:MAG TPA: hypothetical protein VLV87_04745 [Gammaproteobacteria bacterium]|nr:hypothetical protein [Gammaproteobacteria bacterium]